jgi:hypothetical protein
MLECEDTTSVINHRENHRLSEHLKEREALGHSVWPVMAIAGRTAGSDLFERRW